MWTQEIKDWWNGKVGVLNETAPASDTAPSGLNGRLQRIAQRLTTLIAGILLKTDIGRVAVSLYATNSAVGATGVETIATLNISVGIGAITTGTSYLIPAGKTLRILNKTLSSKGNAVATLAQVIFSLRINAAGAVTAASTPVIYQVPSDTPAVANAVNQITSNTPQGIDIVGDGTLQIGLSTNAVYVVNAPTFSAQIEAFLFTT